ncbi:J domain-containing protein [Alteraurantiacibacter palmitatis]|jgi:DnaJ-class molecular chaperone|uniref:J domain-containing protein n=1 Tax=Alteraurantiacibacter palmitatis TaxID=2054628 RepID=A0ABV7ECW0_9SPHN
MADPYTILGVSRTADQSAIKKAYRKLAKELHPDRNKDKPDAAARFAEVTQAYDLLSDAEQRARYDRGEIDEQGNPRAPYGFEDFQGHGPFSGGGPFRSAQDGATSFHFSGDSEELGDIFADLFGRGRGAGGREYRPRGSDVLYAVNVPFENIATAKPFAINLDGGEQIEVKIPPGTQSGDRLRVAGKGRPGPGGRGDAILELTVTLHPFFRQDEDDIRLDLPIRWDEAVLGAKVRVPTIDGPIMLTVPKGSTSGRVLRIKGKGMARRQGGRGNQLVRLMVDLPQNDKSLEAWAKEWREKNEYNPRSKLGV